MVDVGLNDQVPLTLLLSKPLQNFTKRLDLKHEYTSMCRLLGHDLLLTVQYVFISTTQ